VLIDLEKLGKTGFVGRYGGLYEHSPWVAESAWLTLENDKNVNLDVLREHLRDSVNNASKEQKLSLLRAHPELAGKACVEGTLTAESTGEQASARLDMCSKHEFECFQKLNTQYNDKFGFPFILAVRDKTRSEILRAFELRVNNSSTDEFDTALEQVHQIASLRLNALENVESNK